MRGAEIEREEESALTELSHELEDALDRLRGATEELPPLDELAALQEAMVGLAQMGAVLRSLQRSSWEEIENEERPAHDDC